MKKTFRQLLFVIGAVLFASFALTACGPTEPDGPEGGEGDGETETAEYEFSTGALFAVLNAEQNVYQYVIMLEDKNNTNNTVALSVVGRGYSEKYTPVAATYPVEASQNGMVTVTSIVADESEVSIGGNKYNLSGGSIEIKGVGGNFSLEGSITYNNGKAIELSCALPEFTNIPYGEEVASLSSNINVTMDVATATMQVVSGTGGIVSLKLYNGTIQEPTAVFYTAFGVDTAAARTRNIDGTYQLLFPPQGYDIVVGAANASVGMTLQQGGDPVFYPTYYMDPAKIAFLIGGRITIVTSGETTSVTCDATSFTGKRIQISYSGTLDVSTEPSAAPEKIASRKVPMQSDKVSLR
jgi:hypothetical protein